LQERGDGGGSVELDDPVEVTDVDSELQGRGGHDDAVASLRERLLGLAALVDRQRRVRHEGTDLARSQGERELLGLAAALAEHQPLLPRVQGGHDGGGILDTADVVQADLRRSFGPLRGRGEHHAGPGRPGAALQPTEQRVGVADGGGQADPLDRAAGQVREPFQHGEQVPAAVVAGEGMHLVHDDRPDIGEELPRVGERGHQDRLDRLRRGEQDVGPLDADPAALPSGCVAVPETRRAAEPAGVAGDAGVQVVQQCPKWTDIEHRQPAPVPVGHRGQGREDGRLGLPPRGRGEQQRVPAVQQRVDRRGLQRPQRRPAEGVDDVVDQARVQPRCPGGGGHGRSRSMSSTLRTTRPAALRSTSVNSPATSVPG
jgi:hypothetical protein